MTNEDLADQFEDSKVKGSKVKGSKVKLAALAIIDRELQRLHVALNRGDGDTDTTQDQIGGLHDELIRISQEEV
jgi:hypothetical protein